MDDIWFLTAITYCYYLYGFEGIVMITHKDMNTIIIYAENMFIQIVFLKYT